MVQTNQKAQEKGAEHDHYRSRLPPGLSTNSFCGYRNRGLGHITKQGNSLLRFLLVEAAQVTARSLPEWRSKYVHLTMRRGRKIAKVAMARKLAVRLYWMMRKEWDYEQLKKFGSHAGQPGYRHGVKSNIE